MDRELEKPIAILWLILFLFIGLCYVHFFLIMDTNIYTSPQKFNKEDTLKTK